MHARGLRDLDGAWGIFLEKGEDFGLGDHSVGLARHVGDVYRRRVRNRAEVGRTDSVICWSLRTKSVKYRHCSDTLLICPQHEGVRLLSLAPTPLSDETVCRRVG